MNTDFEPLTVEDQKIMYDEGKIRIVRKPETKRQRQIRAFNELRALEARWGWND